MSKLVPMQRFFEGCVQHSQQCGVMTVRDMIYGRQANGESDSYRICFKMRIQCNNDDIYDMHLEFTGPLSHTILASNTPLMASWR